MQHSSLNNLNKNTLWPRPFVTHFTISVIVRPTVPLGRLRPTYLASQSAVAFHRKRGTSSGMVSESTSFCKVMLEKRHENGQLSKEVLRIWLVVTAPQPCTHQAKWKGEGLEGLKRGRAVGTATLHPTLLPDRITRDVTATWLSIFSNSMLHLVAASTHHAFIKKI